MFGTRKYRTAAGMMHSSNIDELMEAFRDEANPTASAVPARPAAEAIEPAFALRSVNPTAGNTSGAIAAEVSYKSIGRAA